MRRPIAMVLTTILLTTSAAAAVAQEPEPIPDPGSQRVEVTEAGIALAFPDDWSTVVQMVREEAILPPQLSGADPVDRWVVLESAAPDGSGCGMVMYDEHPLSLEAHAEWIESGYGEEADVISTTVTHVGIPVGDAIRFDVVIKDTGVLVAYLFESDEARYQLGCMDAERHEDDWRSIAETVELIPLEPLELPGSDDLAPGADVDYVLDFTTVVLVVPSDTPDFPMASLMNADCAFAVRIPAEDGSAREWLACTLSDDPLQPPEQEGVPPGEMVTESGGECLWRSDYWYETDRSQVMASAYGLTVMPDGQVFGWSTYPAEPLDCPGM